MFIKILEKTYSRTSRKRLPKMSSPDGRLQEVPNIVMRFRNVWYFGKLGGHLREVVATGGSTVYKDN